MISHHGLSERRATRLLKVDRSSVRYKKQRKSDEAERALLKELAAERRRFGYRRLREMARRKGVVMNLKKVYRLYCEEGMKVRRRGGRKRAIGTRAPLEKASAPNAIWVLDFVSDTLETCRRFRVFNVEDQFTRRGLGVEIDTSLPGKRIVRVLDRLVAHWGRPKMIVSDNGTELTCNVMLKCRRPSRISNSVSVPRQLRRAPNGRDDSRRSRDGTRVPRSAPEPSSPPSAPRGRQ